MSSFQTDLLYQKRLDISAVLTISSSGMWTSGLSLAVLRVPASVLYQLRSCEAPSSLGVRLSPLILPCRGADRMSFPGITPNRLIKRKGGLTALWMVTTLLHCFALSGRNQTAFFQTRVTPLTGILLCSGRN